MCVMWDVKGQLIIIHQQHVHSIEIASPACLRGQSRHRHIWRLGSALPLLVGKPCLPACTGRTLSSSLTDRAASCACAQGCRRPSCLGLRSGSWRSTGLGARWTCPADLRVSRTQGLSVARHGRSVGLPVRLQSRWERRPQRSCDEIPTMCYI